MTIRLTLLSLVLAPSASLPCLTTRSPSSSLAPRTGRRCAAPARFGKPWAIKFTAS
jgi:hypothetical protein